MRVARDTGRSIASVAGDSYALTLFAWGHLIADDARDRLLRQGESLGLANDIAIGFHEPKKLKDRHLEYQDALGMRESAEDAVSRGIDLAAKVALAHETDAMVRHQATPGGVE